MADLIIYRNATPVATVSIDEKTVLTKKIMETELVSASFVVDAVIPIELGDYITVDNQNYYLNHLPSIDKDDNDSFKYQVNFSSILFDLNNKLLISADGLSDFSYVGTAEEILTLIVTNQNEITNGWAVGVVDESEPKTLQFVNDTCRSALTRLVEAFGWEYELVGKTINFKEAIGTATAYSFEYGQGNGLYEIARRQVDNKAVFTRVYGFGSTKNIKYDYRNNAQRLVFNERYLEKNVALFGVREGQFTDDSIYPQRTGTLNAVNVAFDDDDTYDAENSYVEDTAIDFDVNDYLLEGQAAKIVFKSGDLSGSEFEIWKYDHATKRIYFNTYVENNDYALPNLTNKPQIGDTYTLVDITMPQIYVIQAEEALKAATQRYIDAHAVPKSIYLVKIDPKYVKANAINITAGDLVGVVDQHLGIDRAIRISQISYPLVNPSKITAIIADFIPYSLQQLVTASAKSTSSIIKSITNTINNINNTTVNNTTVVNPDYPKENTVVIHGREFRFTKATWNSGAELETGDTIYDNYWDDTTYVNEWIFKGGDKEVRTNWEEIQTTITE